MSPLIHRLVRGLLIGTGLQYWPVRARGGFNAGARWTLYPWTSYWRGTHEPVVTRALSELDDLHGKVCWDLGAHFGYYASGFAQRVGPTGHVLAVEPFPSSFARLERHRMMNRFSWMNCVHAAASDRDGDDELFVDITEGDTGVHLAYDANERADRAAARLRVHTVRLDGLVARGGTRPPNMIKIDVEGHGHAALAGAMDSLRQTRPIIFMAFHSTMEIDGAKALLDPLGYRWEPLQLGPTGTLGGADVLLRPA